MLPEDVRTYCLQMKGVTEGFPFGEDTLVFKVSDKMFALLSLVAQTMNLKCDPAKAIELREQYEDVQPGYHMSKKHWNTIRLAGRIPDRLIRAWIDDSYRLVVSGLSRAEQRQLEEE